ncbi:MAG: OsmC family protein [Methanospirillum sp.]|uniref:OsmC family protein n=1 Tax=Methanospirillum sp. TaxID=45200 RepID=UPI0023735250|nr:OsmC family protein [Methanospirillum sp.]MDD1728372.1 OsmC family protein [Methanospirillum sp.]
MNNPSMTMHVLQVEPLRYVAKTSTGKEIIAEPSGMLGGKEEYPNPMEYFIASIGTCIAIKTHINLIKTGKIPDKIGIEMKCTRSQIPPEILKQIHMVITVTGDLDEIVVNRVIQETMTLSCPVNVMVSRIARVTWEFMIKHPDI